MPEPVFCLLARTREKEKLPVADVAQELGVGGSFLFDLEEFTKSVPPDYRTADGRPIAVAVYDFLRSHHIEISELQVWVRMNADRLFHSIIPFLQNIFLPLFPSPPVSFHSFFIEFQRLIIGGAPADAEKVPVVCPFRLDVAEAINYVFNRVWGKATKRRRLAKVFQDIKYVPTGKFVPGEPMGIFEGPNALRRALHLAESNQPPYFAYLILYIYTIDYIVSPVPDIPVWPVQYLECKKLNVLSREMPPWRAAFCLAAPDGPVTFFFPSILTDTRAFLAVPGNHVSPLLRCTGVSPP